jgi:hypothetical protein
MWSSVWMLNFLKTAFLLGELLQWQFHGLAPAVHAGLVEPAERSSVATGFAF